MGPTPSQGHRALAGQIAIGTGGGQGIGRAIAQALASAGAAVAVTARSAGPLAATVTAIPLIQDRSRCLGCGSPA
jgi:NAD(P)-dependent dehydrogenase (short-subunit alcohol dehydrogenase family)